MKKFTLLALFALGTLSFAQQEPAKKEKKVEATSKEGKAVNTQKKATSLKSTNVKKNANAKETTKAESLKAEKAETKKK